jgi:choline kinase
MSKVNECLILAAGNGSRLRSVSGILPKPLVQFRGVPIIEHVIRGGQACGIDKFVIVVGYGSELIRDWFQNRRFDGISVTLVNNPDYHKSNGISALTARREMDGDFLLLMADHVFEPETAMAFVKQRLAPEEVILAVDSGIDCVFDLDDATKVRRAGNFIVDIGKDLVTYDALDTGMFLCTKALFASLEAVKRNGDCSLSDGMRRLARERKLRAWEIGDNRWHDLDTPEALAHAVLAFDVPSQDGSLTGTPTCV